MRLAFLGLLRSLHKIRQCDGCDPHVGDNNPHFELVDNFVRILQLNQTLIYNKHPKAVRPIPQIQPKVKQNQIPSKLKQILDSVL